MTTNDSFSQRPRIAHITNHGYGGVHVPTGGAPDTGGQNVYVNAVVEAMVELGYHVTVFARGGFPFFESDQLREGIEPYGDHARYVYVPGGGDEFIRKEDIAIALDEEVDWLERFVIGEAAELGCQPWDVYQLVNTHYWDAGVMGMELQARWRSQRALELLEPLLEGTLSEQQQKELEQLDTHSAVGREPAQYVGRLLYESTDQMTSPATRVAEALERWRAVKKPAMNDDVVQQAVKSFEERSASLSPTLASLAAADAIGAAVLGAWSVRVPQALAGVERHVFTPHSLGVLKEENYRDKPPEVVRNLKFCERRNHETALCASARAFAATSIEIAERLRTHISVATDKIFFFPPCVDRSKFKRYEGEVVDRSYEYLAEKSGVDQEKLRQGLIIYETSRMDRTKRKDLLLRSFATVAREVEEVYLFIGGGPENAIYRELEAIRTEDEVLRQRAFLLGYVPNEAMFPLFAMADLFVSASEMEGFGMSIAQAAAVGTPIIASHLIPFAVQYVPDDALIVRAGDTQGFAEAMLKLLRDKEDRERRGARVEELTTPLDWTVQAEAFLDHLRRHGLEIEKPRRKE